VRFWLARRVFLFILIIDHAVATLGEQHSRGYSVKFENGVFGACDVVSLLLLQTRLGEEEGDAGVGKEGTVWPVDNVVVWLLKFQRIHKVPKRRRGW
jgi:hypothetical protein